jgi:hypothetical protein
MSSYINYLTMAHTYGYFWGKYRPALLKLMIASAGGPQQYKFSSHEVRTAAQKDKGALAFTLRIHKSKSVNDIRSSLIAKDLLQVLQQSKKVSELTESSTYEFKFDRHFVLHVTKEGVGQELPEALQSTVTEHIGG